MFDYNDSDSNIYEINKNYNIRNKIIFETDSHPVTTDKQSMNNLFNNENNDNKLNTSIETIIDFDLNSLLLKDKLLSTIIKNIYRYEASKQNMFILLNKKDVDLNNLDKRTTAVILTKTLLTIKREFDSVYSRLNDLNNKLKIYKESSINNYFNNANQESSINLSSNNYNANSTANNNHIENTNAQSKDFKDKKVLNSLSSLDNKINEISKRHLKSQSMPKLNPYNKKKLKSLEKELEKFSYKRIRSELNSNSQSNLANITNTTNRNISSKSQSLLKNNNNLEKAYLKKSNSNVSYNLSNNNNLNHITNISNPNSGIQQTKTKTSNENNDYSHIKDIDKVFFKSNFLISEECELSYEEIKEKLIGIISENKELIKWNRNLLNENKYIKLRNQNLLNLLREAEIRLEKNDYFVNKITLLENKIKNKDFVIQASKNNKNMFLRSNSSGSYVDKRNYYNINNNVIINQNNDHKQLSSTNTGNIGNTGNTGYSNNGNAPLKQRYNYSYNFGRILSRKQLSKSKTHKENLTFTNASNKINNCKSMISSSNSTDRIVYKNKNNSIEKIKSQSHISNSNIYNVDSSKADITQNSFNINNINNVGNNHKITKHYSKPNLSSSKYINIINNNNPSRVSSLNKISNKNEIRTLLNGIIRNNKDLVNEEDHSNDSYLINSTIEYKYQDDDDFKITYNKPLNVNSIINNSKSSLKKTNENKEIKEAKETKEQKDFNKANSIFKDKASNIEGIKSPFSHNTYIKKQVNYINVKGNKAVSYEYYENDAMQENKAFAFDISNYCNNNDNNIEISNNNTTKRERGTNNKEELNNNENVYYKKPLCSNAIDSLDNKINSEINIKNNNSDTLSRTNKNLNKETITNHDAPKQKEIMKSSTSIQNHQRKRSQEILNESLNKSSKIRNLSTKNLNKQYKKEIVDEKANKNINSNRNMLISTQDANHFSFSNSKNNTYTNNANNNNNFKANLKKPDTKRDDKSINTSLNTSLNNSNVYSSRVKYTYKFTYENKDTLYQNAISRNDDLIRTVNDIGNETLTFSCPSSSDHQN